MFSIWGHAPEEWYEHLTRRVLDSLDTPTGRHRCWVCLSYRYNHFSLIPFILVIIIFFLFTFTRFFLRILHVISWCQLWIHANSVNFVIVRRYHMCVCVFELGPPHTPLLLNYSFVVGQSIDISNSPRVPPSHAVMYSWDRSSVWGLFQRRCGRLMSIW